MEKAELEKALIAYRVEQKQSRSGTKTAIGKQGTQEIEETK